MKRIARKQIPWFILWPVAFLVLLAAFILFYCQKLSPPVFLLLIIMFTALAVLSGVLFEWNSNHSPKAKPFWMIGRALTVFIPLIPALMNALRLDAFYTLPAFLLCCAGVLIFFLLGSHIEKKQNHT